MPANYVLLATQTVGASAASVTFDNIPQTGYTDLKVVMSVRSTDDYLNISFNGLTTNLSSKTLGANSGGAFSISASTGLVYGLSNSNSWTANTFSNAELYVPNYTSSNPKSWSVDAVTENNGTAITLALNAGLWNSSAAITSISFNQGSNNILAGSTFYLYGLAAVGTTPAIAPFASGGDVIANDGTYWYHAFKTTGAFVPAKALTCDYLVVAGGGGGGSNGGGGGGAGGAIVQSATSLTVQSYSVSVGAGGAAGTNGTNTVFGANTAIGGGKGGPFNQGGTSGGSGGGGGMSAGASVTGGSATSGQGFAGGTGSSAYSSSTGGGGGGGGAGAVGTNATNANPMLGAGGVGVSGATYSFINGMGAAIGVGQLSGGNYYFAGGGSGGPSGHSVSNYGGLGGGANFNASATVNTGGGGGAGQAYGSDSPGAGGSGIVIIRYAMA